MFQRTVLTLIMCLCVVSGGYAGKAGIVIQNSTGEVITRCVSFEEDSLTVSQLLKRSGFTVVTEDSQFGEYLLYLHDDGVQPGESHPEDWFWNFYLHEDGEWETASVGISSATASDGSLFGFVFGPWGGSQPPALTFSDVCELTSTAAIVIDHSDGTRKIEKVTFNGETLTVEQLLRQSDLEIVLGEFSWGVAICSLDGEGQPENDCFGDPEGRFWNFNLLSVEGEWQSSPVGISDVIVRDHDVLGFMYGTGEAEQPAVTKQEIFSPQSTPTPAVTPTPTLTPTPVPATPTPPISARGEVFVYDTPSDNIDLTGQTDFDGIDDLSLTIAWSGDQGEASAWDIYMREGFGGFTFLKRINDSSAVQFEWNAETARVAPQVNQVYTFRVVRIDNQLTPDDYRDQAGWVGLNFEGGQPVSFIDPDVPNLQNNEIVIYDDLLGGRDLSLIGEDVDRPEWRALQIAWNFEVGESEVLNYHLLVRHDPDESFTYLGQTNSGSIPYFWWTQERWFMTRAEYRDGPQDGERYQFRVVMFTEDGERQGLTSEWIDYRVSE